MVLFSSCKCAKLAVSEPALRAFSMPQEGASDGHQKAFADFRGFRTLGEAPTSHLQHRNTGWQPDQRFRGQSAHFPPGIGHNCSQQARHDTSGESPAADCPLALQAVKGRVWFLCVLHPEDPSYALQHPHQLPLLLHQPRSEETARLEAGR